MVPSAKCAVFVNKSLCFHPPQGKVLIMATRSNQLDSGSVIVRSSGALPSTGTEGELRYVASPAGLYQYRAGVWTLLLTSVTSTASTVVGGCVEVLSEADIIAPFTVSANVITFTRGELNAKLAGVSAVVYSPFYTTPYIGFSGVGNDLVLNQTLAQIQSYACIQAEMHFQLYHTGGSPLAVFPELHLCIVDGDGLLVGGTTTLKIDTDYTTIDGNAWNMVSVNGVASYSTASHKTFFDQLGLSSDYRVAMQAQCAGAVILQTNVNRRIIGQITWRLN